MKNSTCETCPYFSVQGEVDKPSPTVIKTDQTEKIKVGYCVHSRAQMMVSMEPATLEPGKFTRKTERMFPTTSGPEFCGDHPDRVLELERQKAEIRAGMIKRMFPALIAEAVKAVNAPLVHDPMKYPDTGFNRAPSLDEAKMYDARVVLRHSFAPSSLPEICAECKLARQDSIHVAEERK